MCHRPLRVVWMLILAVALAAPIPAQQKPLTQEQVQALVHDGHGDATGAKLIALHGIDFTPTDDFIASLESAGANDAFVQALRLTARLQTGGGEVQTGGGEVQTGGGAIKKPLTEVQIISLIAGEVPSQRVAMLVRERGINFDPTNEFLRELRLAGGDEDLDAALRRVQVTKPERANPAVAAQDTEVRQHTARAAQFLRNKDYEDAEAEYRAAIRLDPQNADLHIGLGMTLGGKGDWDGQIAEDRAAVRLSPDNDRAHQSLGMALARKNYREGSIAEYREAIRLNPDNEGAHVSLGIRLSQVGDWDGAIAEYTEAVRLSPNNYGAHYSLGMAYEKEGNRQAALQEYRRAYELNPNIPTYKQAYDRLSSQ